MKNICVPLKESFELSTFVFHLCGKDLVRYLITTYRLILSTTILLL
jgi:hypothetical protein